MIHKEISRTGTSNFMRFTVRVDEAYIGELLRIAKKFGISADKALSDLVGKNIEAFIAGATQVKKQPVTKKHTYQLNGFYLSETHIAFLRTLERNRDDNNLVIMTLHGLCRQAGVENYSTIKRLIDVGLVERLRLKLVAGSNGTKNVPIFAWVICVDMKGLKKLSDARGGV